MAATFGCFYAIAHNLSSTSQNATKVGSKESPCSSLRIYGLKPPTVRCFHYAKPEKQKLVLVIFDNFCARAHNLGYTCRNATKVGSKESPCCPLHIYGLKPLTVCCFYCQKSEKQKRCSGIIHPFSQRFENPCFQANHDLQFKIANYIHMYISQKVMLPHHPPPLREEDQSPCFVARYLVIKSGTKPSNFPSYIQVASCEGIPSHSTRKRL